MEKIFFVIIKIKRNILKIRKERVLMFVTEKTINKICQYIKETYESRNLKNYLFALFFFIILFIGFLFVTFLFSDNLLINFISSLAASGIFDFFVLAIINGISVDSELLNLRKKLENDSLPEEDINKIIDYTEKVLIKWEFKNYYENICKENIKKILEK
jgi:hypothetical protein